MNVQENKRVLLLEPYYGGSHKLFLQGLQKYVDAEYTILTLPARKWKMRMQFSAIWFVQQLAEMLPQKIFFDVVLCSTFVDVALLRALLFSLKGWNHQATIKTYFHENQFAYPNQQSDLSMRQFRSINFTTALASDGCAFNSNYNLDTFLSGVQGVTKVAADMQLISSVENIRQKSVVLYPGMDYSAIDENMVAASSNDPPIIVWNHRWEHDKGPDIFFDALYALQEKKAAFQLIVLGKSYPHIPEYFHDAQNRLKKRIVHFAYAESRQQYAELLLQADIIVSTAKHEFFGIAILEGVRAGCYPLLPAKLSYPELFDKEFLYTPDRLVNKLENYLQRPSGLGKETAERLTERFSWQVCKEKYMKWLFS